MLYSISDCAIMVWRQAGCAASSFVLRLKAAPLLAAVVLFEIVHAIGGDQQTGVVAARDEVLLNQIPHREFQMLPRPPRQIFELVREDARAVRLETTTRVERFEHHEARVLFAFETIGSLA